MNEINYGFVDSNNVLRGTAVCIEDDFETIERVKNEYNSHAYYPILDIIVYVDLSYWNGSRFLLPSPYPSWIFDEELNDWIAPVAQPEFDEENPKYYAWNEEILNWEEIQVSE